MPTENPCKEARSRTVKEEWLSHIEFANPDTPAFFPRETFKAYGELDPITLLGKIQNGTRVARNAVCAMHGPFVLAGWHFENWIAWAGREQGYSEYWTGDEGSCYGCRIKLQDLLADRPELRRDWPRHFELETLAICLAHGPLILKADVNVYPDGSCFEEKIRIDEDWCPCCESETLHEMSVQDSLGLSDEEWASRGEWIMAALRAPVASRQ